MVTRRPTAWLLVLAVSIASVPSRSMGSTEAWTIAELRGSERVAGRVLDVLALRQRARVLVVFEPAIPGSKPGKPPGAGSGEAISRARVEILGMLPAEHFRLQRGFRRIAAFAGDVTAEGLLVLAADPRVRRVDLDEGGTGHLVNGIPLAEVDEFQALGFTGQGVTVAILDSGYDSDHGDLSDDLVAEQCFCSASGAGCCPNGSTTQSGAGAAEDDHGHGTNVSGIVTSKGTISPLGGAPDAGVVAIKVLAANGGFCCSSDVVAGLDWILAERPDVDVVNMSLGTFALFAGSCDDATSFTMAFASAIDSLQANGVAVFASSGNSGSGTQMSAPACVSNAIATAAAWDSDVGSVAFANCTDLTTAADKLTCFSNTNSTTDLVAPGAFTTSAGLGGGSSTFAGTSQASPLAAACAALLLEKAPGTSPDRLEERLEASPTLVTDSTNGLSFPRLDCHHAGVPCTEPATLDLSTTQTVLGFQEETACGSIEAGPYPIGGTGEVTFSAGDTIVLRDGFSVASGGSFRAVIDGLLLPPP